MKKRLYLPLALLFGLAMLTTSCKDDPAPPPPEPTTASVLIVNSGLATEGTGTLTTYDPLGKNVDHNVFYKSNTYPVGNTLFSALVDGDRTFLILSGTGEILVVNSDSYKLMERIGGFGAPRYITKVGEYKYYVSDWQENAVWPLYVYKSGNVKLLDPVPTGVAPEKMAVWEDLVFVVNSGSVFSDSTMSIVHSEGDTVMANIVVGHNPNSLQIDKNGVLWVLCSGIEDEQNPFGSTQGRLVSYDLAHDSMRTYLSRDSLVALDTLFFDDNQVKPTSLTLNAANDVLYFLDNDTKANVMRFDMEIGLLPTVPFITGSFNSIGYDANNEEIYLADQLSRTVDGEVYRFNEVPEELDLFKVGIIPENFAFK